MSWSARSTKKHPRSAKSSKECTERVPQSAPLFGAIVRCCFVIWLLFFMSCFGCAFLVDFDAEMIHKSVSLVAGRCGSN